MSLKKVLPFLFLSLSSAFAVESDLTLPGEKWVAKFKTFVCDTNGVSVAKPTALSQFKVNFEQLTTDRTLDNGLVKANFREDGKRCRYSALLLADNSANTIKLVDSKAYAVDQDGECAEGKALLDEALSANDYLYYGHPHHLAIMIPVQDAEEVCGAGATHVGVDFVVSGRIAN